MQGLLSFREGCFLRSCTNIGIPSWCPVNCMPLNALKSYEFLPSPSASGGSMTAVRLTQHLRWEAQCLEGAMGFGFSKNNGSWEAMHCLSNLTGKFWKPLNFSFDSQCRSGCSHCRAIITQHHLRQSKAPNPPECVQAMNFD